MNRKECIDDLNYTKKALTEGTLTRYDAIIFLIDTLTEYLEKDELDRECSRIEGRYHE